MFGISKKRIEQDSGYQIMLTFMEKVYDYEQAKAPDMLFEYAQDKYNLMEGTIPRIEGKAGDVIHYLLLVIGLFTFFVNGLSTSCNAILVYSIMAGLIFLSISLAFALSVKATYAKKHPATIRSTFDMDQSDKETKITKLRIALSYGLAFEALKTVSEIKAWRLKWSYRFMAIGLCIFLVSFFVKMFN